MAALWLAFALPISILPLISPPVIRAALHNKRVYTSGVTGRSSETKWTAGSGHLWLFRMDLNEGSPITSLEYEFGNSGRWNGLLRWQLISSRYYCVNYPWSDGAPFSRAGYTGGIPLVGIEVANANRNSPDFYPHQFQKYRKLLEGGVYLRPVGSATTSMERSVQERVFFDLWCRGDKQYEVYVTEPDNGNRLTRHDFHPERTIRADQDPILLWETVGEWKVDWQGPFYVAPIGDNRFFLTDTGRVFLAPQGDKPGTPLKELWKGPPVDILIHDGDGATWYAFTKDQFFEIADPIKPKPHRVNIRREWTAIKAVETAALCGRVIRSLPRMSDPTWDELASPEPRVGHQAVWGMCNEPARAVALLKERLKPVASPPAKELAALIDDLGAESFAKREAAQKRLREFGQTIEPSVREAASTAANPEGKRRLNQLLTECQSIASRTPDEIRAVRAVQVLERIGNPESRRLLEACAKGADAAILTRQARTALKALHDR
jgi:hypothetical protein